MRAYIFIVCLLGAASAENSAARGRKKIARANNDFSQRLYQQIALGANNQIYSGYSIHLAMSMTSLGARGGTRRELETSLGLNVFTSRTARNQAYNDVIEKLNSARRVKVLTANGIFVNQARTVEGAFVNGVRNYYEADVSNFDPRDPAGPETVINDYVENKTQGLIRDLIPQNAINSLTMLVVVNTLYFNASWQDPFDEYETRLADFFTAQGTSQVTTMFSTTTMKIKRNFYGADVGELALGNGRFSFFILLPHDVSGLVEQEISLTNPGRIKALFEGLRYVRVSMSLPKFNIESRYELKEPLQALGIVKAFDQVQANFTGINSGGGIYVSKVFHQAVIEVNEAGVVAAAATAVVIEFESMQLSPPETFYVNRPFIFFIRDNVQKMILFQGKYIE